MFMAQVVGTLIAAIVYLSTAWWLMETIPDICDQSSDSLWTCPSDHVFYDASVVWGLIGPRKMFGDQGLYGAVNWFFLGVAVAPVLVWAAAKAIPGQEWIRLVNMLILIGACGQMPPATAVNYTSWIILGFSLSGFHDQPWSVVGRQTGQHTIIPSTLLCSEYRNTGLNNASTYMCLDVASTLRMLGNSGVPPCAQKFVSTCICSEFSS
ncbi:hypothetical protein SASPL_130591 [Salvia splendens]|uniref:Uncharacterized protein n=1 Tax=Salvia splendens TaxID=180675 RepID=A0A8X8X4H4_SALSN|nr:hypothetical protein SASPL_130591 [Salvia splendens]